MVRRTISSGETLGACEELGHVARHKAGRNFCWLLPFYEQPLVAPQVLHFMQVPLRTNVKLPHAPQLSPSKPFIRASATRRECACLEDSATSMLATCAPTGLATSVASMPARISERSSVSSCSKTS